MINRPKLKKKKRVTAEGKGETEQIIDCVKVLCSKEDYEKNRRSEFTIIDLTKE